jgi:hypothetical protein
MGTDSAPPCAISIPTDDTSIYMRLYTRPSAAHTSSLIIQRTAFWRLLSLCHHHPIQIQIQIQITSSKFFLCFLLQSTDFLYKYGFHSTRYGITKIYHKRYCWLKLLAFSDFGSKLLSFRYISPVYSGQRVVTAFTTTLLLSV